MNLIARVADTGTAVRPTRQQPRELVLDTILQGDCIAEMARLPDKCVDMIFADPPYGEDPGRAMDGAAVLLAPGGVLIVQADAGEAVLAPAGLKPLSRRDYGRNVFHFFGIPLT